MAKVVYVNVEMYLFNYKNKKISNIGRSGTNIMHIPNNNNNTY